MKVICAWCQDIIREENFFGLEDSHGICEKCRDVYYPKMEKKKSINQAPIHQGVAFLLSTEAIGTFSHWPKVDYGLLADSGSEGT
jgi:hypothetical protein